MKIFYTAVKDNQIEIIFLREFYILIRQIITFFIIDQYKLKFNSWQVYGHVDLQSPRCEVLHT
jgi:hypothetical protein